MTWVDNNIYLLRKNFDVIRMHRRQFITVRHQLVSAIFELNLPDSPVPGPFAHPDLFFDRDRSARARMPVCRNRNGWQQMSYRGSRWRALGNWMLPVLTHSWNRPIYGMVVLSMGRAVNVLRMVQVKISYAN